MRAEEFAIAEKKRRKRRSRWAAYGPGPYGGYGYLTGYSGDGGDGVGEASYEGNIGMMEVAKFFKIANTAQKKLFKELLEKGKRGLAWKLIQDVTGTRLQGREFEIGEDRTADVVFDTGEKKRVRYQPTNKDIVDTIIKYYLKQGLKVVRVNDKEIAWNGTNEGWRDTLAGLALGAGVAMSGAADAKVNIERVAVGKGDTVYSIAKAFDTTPDIIKKLNKLDKNFTIKPGDTLKVPAGEVVDEPSKEKKAEPQKKKMPKSDANKTLTGTVHEAALTQAAREAGITDIIELAAFLAQTAHESHNFQSMVEYGDKDYFKQYEPKFLKDKKTGKIIIDPETKKYKNFNKKAHGLGNDTRGDGIRYKGRGYIQITGKDNYRRVGNRIGVDLVKNPELAEKPEIAAKIAIMYWKLRTQPEVDDFNDVRAVTKTINPGLDKLAKRKQLFQDFKQFKLAQR